MGRREALFLELCPLDRFCIAREGFASEDANFAQTTKINDAFICRVTVVRFGDKLAGRDGGETGSGSLEYRVFASSSMLRPILLKTVIDHPCKLVDQEQPRLSHRMVLVYCCLPDDRVG